MVLGIRQVSEALRVLAVDLHAGADPASVERFMRAVAPIDTHRINMRSGSDTSGSLDTTQPQPETPAPAPVADGAASFTTSSSPREDRGPVETL